MVDFLRGSFEYTRVVRGRNVLSAISRKWCVFGESRDDKYCRGWNEISVGVSVVVMRWVVSELSRLENRVGFFDLVLGRYFRRVLVDFSSGSFEMEVTGSNLISSLPGARSYLFPFEIIRTKTSRLKYGCGIHQGLL